METLTKEELDKGLDWYNSMPAEAQQLFWDYPLGVYLYRGKQVVVEGYFLGGKVGISNLGKDNFRPIQPDKLTLIGIPTQVKEQMEYISDHLTNTSIDRFIQKLHEGKINGPHMMLANGDMVNAKGECA